MEKSDNKLFDGTPSERFHLYSIGANHREELEKRIARDQDHLRVYHELVDKFVEEIDKSKEKSYVSNIDILKNYFRHYWLVNHGILLEEWMYNLRVLNCHDTILSDDKKYIELDSRTGHKIIFINIEEIENLPLYAKEDMWKLAVKDGKTTLGLDDFIQKDFINLCGTYKKNHRLDFLHNWKYLEPRFSNSTYDRDYVIKIFRHIDGNFLMIYPKNAVM